jgi:uncharacterized protein (TIGR02466 family)
MTDTKRNVGGQNQPAAGSVPESQLQRQGAGPRGAHRNLFGTPLLVNQLNDEAMRAGLEDAILANKAADPGINRSNVGGGWHSDLKLLQWGGAAARTLLDHTMRMVNQNTTDVQSAPDIIPQWTVEAWANVNEKGGANMRHIHGGCYWSAVYYVRIDEGTGGDLVLYDPRMPFLAMHAPSLRFKNSGGEREVRIKPRPGLLIAFPSWLAHAVDPWHGEGTRISIALNVSALRVRMPPDMLKGPDPTAKAAALKQQKQALKDDA